MFVFKAAVVALAVSSGAGLQLVGLGGVVAFVGIVVLGPSLA